MQLSRDRGLGERVVVGSGWVATTMPLPGSGTGWTYCRSLPPLAALAAGGRRVQGRKSAAPPAPPYRRNRFRVIPAMIRTSPESPHCRLFVDRPSAVAAAPSDASLIQGYVMSRTCRAGFPQAGG